MVRWCAADPVAPLSTRAAACAAISDGDSLVGFPIGCLVVVWLNWLALHLAEMHVANAGDSRMVLGERRGNRIFALDLSHDQTPNRKDERERCKAAGARIRSMRMVEGIREYSDAWEDALGTEQEDEAHSDDPPRLYSAAGDGPGSAFTRSIGDGVAEEIGCYAIPEDVTKGVSEADQFVVIASDGIWEFLPSQDVVDRCLPRLLHTPSTPRGLPLLPGALTLALAPPPPLQP